MEVLLVPLGISGAVSSRRALSLAEIIIAISLLAVVTVTLVGLLIRLNASSTKSADQSIALELASKIMEESVDATPDRWLEMAQSVDELQAHDSATKTTYFYSVDPVEVSGRTTMGQVYRLDVSVWWWPDTSAKARTRQDYGKLSLRLSRVVFYEHTDFSRYLAP